MSTLNALTDALRDALAATPALAAVHLADAPGPFESARLPAATLTLTHLARPARDDLDALTRARFELLLWRRDPNAQQNARALQRLAESAVAALLADPTVGGRSLVGPAGQALELIEIAPAAAKLQSPPLAALAVRFDCFLLPPDATAAPPPQACVQIDGQPLLASGPHALEVGPWQRRRIDRCFAGLDGLVSIDLGASGRTVSLAGRLVAPTRDALLDQAAAVDALAGASLHTLVEPAGRALADVRIDAVRWGRPLGHAADSLTCVGYRIEGVQLQPAETL